MSAPGSYTLPIDSGRHATPTTPPVDVRLESVVSQLAHDFDLDYDEAAALRALLTGALDTARWFIDAQVRKETALARSQQ